LGVVLAELVLRPAGGEYWSPRWTSVPWPPGAVRNRTDPLLSTDAPSRERQAIRSPGKSSVISASHSTLVPAGLLATQWERPPAAVVTDSRLYMNLGRRSKSRQAAYTS
jgi:hypothetical protein